MDHPSCGQPKLNKLETFTCLCRHSGVIKINNKIIIFVVESCLDFTMLGKVTLKFICYLKKLLSVSN